MISFPPGVSLATFVFVQGLLLAKFGVCGALILLCPVDIPACCQWDSVDPGKGPNIQGIVVVCTDLSGKELHR